MWPSSGIQKVVYIDKKKEDMTKMTSCSLSKIGIKSPLSPLQIYAYWVSRLDMVVSGHVQDID